MQSLGSGSLAVPVSRKRSLDGERVVFTGRLAAMDRRQARRLVQEAGGQVRDHLSSRTSLLVVGLQGWPVLPDGSISRKLEQAEKMLSSGHSLEIASEEVFLQRLGLRHSHRSGRRTCSLQQAAGILGTREDVIRRCGQFGLVHTAGDGLDFQDLVSLRSLLRLVRKGMTPSAIARGLGRLSPHLPEVEQPLAQIRLIAGEGGELLAELQGVRMDARGQFLLNFAGGALSRPAPPIGLRRPQKFAGDPVRWFDVALEFEDDGDVEGAQQAYRKAVEIDPGFTEAHYNLANLLLHGDNPAAAATHYRIALEQEPELVCAWYNLGYALAEQGRFEEAAIALNRALEIFPAYADAHFNLALCCEELDRNLDAVRHWQAFLRLNPAGEWAEIARCHLRSTGLKE